MDGTKEINGIDFNGQEVSQNVVIEKGTTGHLTFIATWKISQDHFEDKLQDKPEIKQEPTNDSNKPITSLPETSSQPTSPKTGDNTQMMLWVGMLCIGGLGLLRLRRKNKQFYH